MKIPIFALFLFVFLGGCNHGAREISSGIVGGGLFFVIFLIGLTFLFAVLNINFDKKLRFLFYLFASIGMAFSIFGLNKYLDSTSIDDYENSWLATHPDAVAASEELKKRTDNRLCAVCGNPGYWALNEESSEDSYGVDHYYWNLDLISKMKDDSDYYACKQHKAYLVFLKDEKNDEAEYFMNENYVGPGRAGIAEASTSGPVIPKIVTSIFKEPFVIFLMVLTNSLMTLGFLLKTDLERFR